MNPLPNLVATAVYVYIVSMLVSSQSDLHTKVATYLLDKHSSRITYFPSDVPVVVKCSVYVRQVMLAESEGAGDLHSFVATLTFREEYKDSYLSWKDKDTLNKLKYINIPQSDEHWNIWHPDTFFQNELNAESIERRKGDRMVRVYQDGRVRISSRLNLEFSCPMNVYYYPYQIIKCPITWSTYAYTDDVLHYAWQNPESPVKVRRKARPTGFTVRYLKSYESTATTSSGTYSSQTILLQFEREQGNRNVLELFIAPGSLLLISMFGLVMDRWKTYGLGLAVGMFCVFFITASLIYSSFPLARHAIVHRWISGCAFIIIFEIVSMTTLILISRKYGLDKKSHDRQMNTTTDATTNPDSSGTVEESEETYALLFAIPTIRSQRNIIDMCRITLFIVLLIAFIVMAVSIVIAIASQ